MGSYGPDLAPIYEGRVGTGISAKVEAELLRKLMGLIAMDAPFGKASPRDAPRRMHWVRPELVARVAFRGAHE